MRRWARISQACVFFLLPASVFPQSDSAKVPVVRANPVGNGWPPGSRISIRTLDVNLATSLRSVSQAGGGDGGAAGLPQTASVTNPAILVLTDGRANLGTGGVTYVSLMPLLNLPDYYLAGAYASLPLGGMRLGGMRLGVRYLAFDFGVPAADTASGADRQDFAGQEYSLTLAKSIHVPMFPESFLGLSAKVVSAPEEFSRRGYPERGYLVDLGYIGAYRSFRAAVSAVNLGYPVSGIRNRIRHESNSVASRIIYTAEPDDSWLLTPPSFQFALGWSRAFDTSRLHILEAAIQAGITVEYQREGWEERRTYPAASASIRLFNVLAPGLTLADEGGVPISRLSLGLYLFNHVYLEYLHNESGSLFFDRQKTFRLEIRNPAKWSKRDASWWYR
jgi:hypothetical protein